MQEQCHNEFKICAVLPFDSHNQLDYTAVISSVDFTHGLVANDKQQVMPNFPEVPLSKIIIYIS
jgi:hypothetical protein